MQIFLFIRSSSHAPILGIGSWNSKRKWASKMSKGAKNFGSLTQKLGRYWGLKKIFPYPSLKTETYDFRNFLPIELSKNPENFIKKPSVEVGQISHFICYPNARIYCCVNPTDRSRYRYSFTSNCLGMNFADCHMNELEFRFCTNCKNFQYKVCDGQITNQITSTNHK